MTVSPPLRIRSIQVSDYDAVRAIFRLGVMDDTHSASRDAIRAQLLESKSQAAYALLGLGTALFFNGSPWLYYTPAVLLPIAYLIRLVYDIRGVFHAFYSGGINSDMGDFAQHYQLVPQSGGNGTQPIGPNGFWVAEVMTDAGWTVAGSIGLDETTAPEGASEVRRMFVSPDHRRLGVAAALMQHLFVHAKEHNVRTLTLITSEYQTVARRMYEGIGFKRCGSRRWTLVGGVGSIELPMYEMSTVF